MEWRSGGSYIKEDRPQVEPPPSKPHKVTISGEGSRKRVHSKAHWKPRGQKKGPQPAGNERQTKTLDLKVAVSSTLSEFLVFLSENISKIKSLLWFPALGVILQRAQNKRFIEMASWRITGCPAAIKKAPVNRAWLVSLGFP